MELEGINGEYRVCRIPGLIATSQKTLLACYECRRGDSSDWAEIDLKLLRSHDLGDTWETVAVMKGDGDTLNNPVMIAEENRIHFLFCKNYKQIFYAFSEDDGKSFSEPREIKDAFEGINFFFNAVAIGPGHGIKHGGRLLVPVWFAYNKEKPKAHHPSFVATLCSEDGGKHWFFGETLPTKGLIDPNESALAVDAKGRVVISIRSESPARCRALATSPGGVGQWSDPQLMHSLSDPVCQGSMISCGDLLLHCNCDSDSGRKNLTVKALDDDFQVRHRLLVDEVGGYSDIAVIDDELFVLYERGALHGNGGLHFWHFPLKNLFDFEDFE
jgi:sialidase-1